MVATLTAASTPPTAIAQEISEQTLQRAKKATVFVITFASKKEKGDTPLGSGSGFFINSTGLLITNNHVVDPAHGMSVRQRQEFQYKTNRLTYRVVTESGTDNEKIWECDLVHQSMTADQALLQARDEEGKMLQTPEYLRLLPPWRLKNRMSVSALGFPGGNRLRSARDKNAEVSVTHGKVSKVPRSPSGRVRRIDTDAIARPGNSGGPMIDIDGAVVGTVTLMGQAEDQANTCSLVPISLTRAFIRDAMVHDRLPQGGDIIPFLDILAEAPGPLSIPEYQRLADRDTLFIGDDERVYGEFADKMIKWESPLGTFEIPSESVAYVLRYDERVSLVFENGDHVSATHAGGKCRFSAEGGAQIDRPFRKVAAVAFRTREAKRKRPKGDVTVLSSDEGRLVFTGVTGKARLTSRSGTVDVPLTDIARIDLEDGGSRQVVSLKDRRIITGHFEEDKYRTRVAGIDQPVGLGLSHVTRARIETVDAGAIGSGGMGLIQILASADADLIDAAKTLERGKGEDARTKLEPFLDKKRMSRMSDVMKAQVRLLDGLISLRQGEPDPMRKIRKCVKAKDPNVAAYARGCVEVIKRYGTEYEGKPISDPDVFTDAGLALGNELIQQANEMLQDRQHIEGKKGEYRRYMNAIKKHERAMQAASTLAGPDADDALMRLWKFALDLCSRENRRLREEYQRIGGGRSKVSLSEYRKLDRILKQHDKLMTDWRDRYVKLQEYGFYHADEPDAGKLDD